MEINNRYTKIAYDYYILHPDINKDINTFVEITKFNMAVKTGRCMR
jgi:hypothetical protein